ncbi:CinA family protein [Solimonas marina]|uniref:CinA family protein n=1 Tax=Solimonas marina TaxID=2714601 RepID=A0A970B7S2_9GAMM|nr:CinA family protein [Solimonas marina]NKF21519.1 CinA family protein [Solimonas marina]
MSDRLIERLAEALLARGEWLATAESCTGGLIAKQLTDLAGSSAWFERGFVTYSNLAKMEMLAVPEEILDAHGAVSGECAAAMVRGILRAAPVDWGVAVTGIAGPGGGSDDKPVGTVWIAWIQRGHAPDAHRFFFEGGRESVREQTAQTALEGLLYRVREAG